MSVQTGLRDSGRHNTTESRNLAIKKGAAPTPYRTAPKAASATFVKPPTSSTAPLANTQQRPAAQAIAAAPCNTPTAVSRAMENEHAMARTAACNTRAARSDYAMASGAIVSTDLGASFPSGASEHAMSNTVEYGSGLRSVSDVPVLSIGCEEEVNVPSAMAVEPTKGHGYMCGHVSPIPGAMPPAAAAAFVSGLTSEDEIVAAFLSSCVGRVADAACTPQGKALLVAALETERPEVLAPVVAEMCDRLRDVSVDANGCHVLRTLLEACTAEQTEELIGAMYPSVILNICTASQHTRLTLQSLFERRLVDLWPVVEVLAANAGYLAATQQGCISLMRVFERCDVEQKSALVHELLPKFSALSMDAFANYMVQCAIEHSDRTTAAQYVVQLFAGHLLQMSCDKFASNVVEKVVRVCGGVPAVRRLLLDELVFNPAALKELVADGYGNFVVQSLVEATTNAMEMKRVEDRLRPALVGSPFAAKIEAKLKAKRLGQGHAAGNGHQQQQQPRRSSCVNNRHNPMNVYGAPVNVAPQVNGAGPRPSSYRVESPAFIMCGTPNVPVAAQGFRHRPYESQAVRVSSIEALQRFQDANAHLRITPVVQTPATTPAAAAPAAELYPFALSGADGDAEDYGPVYGPSPAARRRLQQQQQFRQPFNGVL